MAVNLTPEKALIFRITHRDNLPWMLDHGLYCRSAPEQDPSFVSIGNQDLIGMRAHRQVDVPPGGTLSDYVPFYFTPFSPMLYNIHTGWGGIVRRPNDDIVILVSSLPQLNECGVPYLYTDRHAYLQGARFSAKMSDLPEYIPWALLQARDFKKDPENPEKVERYQAEALVHRHLPVAALLGIICHSDPIRLQCEQLVSKRLLALPVHARPAWYFR